LGFAADLAILVASGSTIEDAGDHLVIRSPQNPLHWWGNFILLRSMPAPGEQPIWVNRFQEAFPGATHVAIGIDVDHGRVEDLRGFTEAGLSADCFAVMTASGIEQPTVVDETLTLRPFGSDGDWVRSIELGVRCEDRALDPTDYRAFLEAKASANRSLVANGNGEWFGTFIDGELVCQLGLVSVGEGRARFQAVETAPDRRRQGLARQLVAFASTWGLDQLGAREVMMVAERDYWAIDLYRSLGFAETAVQLVVERASTDAVT
jgi:ribosomal protein S18 acetylase RimI-like enzyme